MKNQENGSAFFFQTTLEVLGGKKADYFLQEIHEGYCVNHLGNMVLARKALLVGFFWSTMKKNVVVIVKKCQNFQRRANMQ